VRTKPPPKKPQEQRYHPALKKPERIRRIMQLMAGGNWAKGITGPDLAQKWNCSLSLIDKDAAEASRKVRDLFSEEEQGELKKHFLLELKFDKSAARSKGKFDALAKMHDVHAKAIGAYEPQTVNITGTIGDLIAKAFEPDDGEPEG
jgi:hypothetical protein